MEKCFAKPSTFTVLQKDMKQFMDDMTALSGAGYVRVKATDLDKIQLITIFQLHRH